jgi:hypothetical protein
MLICEVKGKRVIEKALALLYATCDEEWLKQ